MSAAIEVWQIEAFLDLFKDSFSIKELSDFLIPKTYTFAGGTFQWLNSSEHPKVWIE
jgi:hypothetical protein